MNPDEHDYVRVGPLELPKSLTSDGDLNIWLDVYGGYNIWFSREEAKDLIHHLVRVFNFCQSEVAGHD